MLLFLLLLIAFAAGGYFLRDRIAAKQIAQAKAAAAAEAQKAAEEEAAAAAKKAEAEAKAAEAAAKEAEESEQAAKEKEQKDEAEAEEAQKWKQATFESDGSAAEAEPDEIANDTEIPEEIRAFVAKYPEAAEFAANYAEYSQLHLPIDISTEVTSDGIPMFMQWDPRWGYELYGGGYMGIRGCGPTCLSMVYAGLSGHTEWNPYRMAQYAEENGYYLENVGTEWGLMQTGAEDLGMTVTTLGASESDIKASLMNGDPVICAMGPGDFTYSGHFIVLADVDGDGSICIRDPNSRINSERTWTAAELLPQIKALWAYHIAEQEVPEESAAGEESGAQDESAESDGDAD